MIDRPELHSHVTFYAEDPERKRNILLNETSSTSEKVTVGCPHFVNVFVTPGQGKLKIITLGFKFAKVFSIDLLWCVEEAIELETNYYDNVSLLTDVSTTT